MPSPDLVALTAAERRLTRAAAKIDDALLERDSAIRELAAAGKSLREIAAIAGTGPDGRPRLTHSGVAKILARITPAD